MKLAGLSLLLLALAVPCAQADSADGDVVEVANRVAAWQLANLESLDGIRTFHHRTEEKLLAACRTAEETENFYVRRCVPRKAELDLIYARRRTMCLDLRLMAATLFRRFSPGRAACRQPSP